MVNQNIAPMAGMSVNERIKEIEKFLDKQEIGVMQQRAVQPVQPIQQTQQTPMGEGDQEMINILKKISENQEIERKRFDRNNPIEGDDPVYDWAEETIDPGQIVIFTYYVPEGHIFYLEYVNIVHNIDTTYSVWIDGEYQPNLSYAIEDFGDHMAIWKPPKMCYNNVQVWALNNWVAAQTYATFFRGFNRFYRAAKREITYDSLKKEKQET